MKKLDLSPKNPASLVTFLLDKSLSMGDCLGATIEGFNSYISKLKEEKEAEIDFTFVQFDSDLHKGPFIESKASLNVLYRQTPIKDVRPLTTKTYIPRGGTPLIDAAYDVIESTIEAVSKRTDNPRVIICIQTDGEENESRRHTWAELKALISSQKERGWEFNFMGAGIDAYHQGHLMGIAAVNTVSYGKNFAETSAAFNASASNQANFSAARSSNTMYSSLQKSGAGDLFDKSDA